MRGEDIGIFSDDMQSLVNDLNRIYDLAGDEPLKESHLHMVMETINMMELAIQGNSKEVLDCLARIPDPIGIAERAYDIRKEEAMFEKMQQNSN